MSKRVIKREQFDFFNKIASIKKNLYIKKEVAQYIERA